jgi:hypothetical protein
MQDFTLINLHEGLIEEIFELPHEHLLMVIEGSFIHNDEDRDLVAMSVQRVVYAGKRIVRLDCRRRFRSSDGWWVGENGIWPFPSIRHQKKGGVS